MQKEIKNTIQIIEKGGVIVYPTDTIWGIGCDIFNADAVSKIYKIKKREDSKSLIILVADIEMLQQYVELDNNTLPYLNSERPTTIIYSRIKNVPKYLLANDGTVAFRIPNDLFCLELIKQLKKPIISTSANLSGEESPHIFSEIKETILSDVDYVVNWRQEDITKNFPSKIIKIQEDGNIQILRA